MNVTINGDNYEFDNSTLSIQNIIKKFSLDIDKIAIELNQNVISQSDYNDVTIKDGDIIEVIAFFGGG